ncbi:MAG: Ppx/GppA phosphatase family protein [Solirubrobacteraceae bacterium]
MSASGGPDAGARPGGVVDIGSNTTRLLIAEMHDGRVREIVRRTQVTRLGAGVDAEGRLRDDAIARVLEMLDRYRSDLDEHDCRRAVAVMTSAVRDAANGPQLAQLVADRYGLEPHVLAGEDEARLTFLGATGELAPGDQAALLVIDIGGGSTELVIGAHGQIEFRVSTQAGVVRQTERHLPSDPPAESELEQLASDVRAILLAAVPAERRAAVKHAIAVAGTATQLAAIAQGLEPYDSSRVQGYQLSRAHCERLLAELAALPLEQRRSVPGLDPERAPTIVAGAVILREVMALFGLERVEVSEHDILHGAFLDLVAPHL